MPRRKLNDPIREHKAAAAGSAGFAVITLSSTRSLEDDQSGDIIQQILESAGHTVIDRLVIGDNRASLRRTLQKVLRRREVQAVVTTGGTGLAASDITVETVRPLLEKELTGFPALFMLVSYPQAGTAAMLSRTVAGTIKGKPIFCLPGSPRACRLATEALIVPEIGHILMVTGLR
jgi:molybdopterin adenylyltransferase